MICPLKRHEPRNSCRRLSGASLIEDIRRWPAEAPEWEVSQAFIDQVQQVASQKHRERDEAGRIQRLQQVLTQLRKNHESDLAFFNFNDSDLANWQANHCPIDQVSEQTERVKDLLAQLAQRHTLEQHVPQNVQEARQHRAGMDAVENRISDVLEQLNEGLGDYLWVQAYSTGAELADVLRAFAQERGWTKAELETLSMEGLPREGTPRLEGWPLPSPLYQVWARGIVHWTQEHGLERHSAVLAQLDRQEALDHRLWRGQAGLLLPQIDEARLALCAHLNQRYGPDWPYKWQEPELDPDRRAVRDTPFACQWGHLESLLRNCPSLERERRWSRLASWSRQIRNDLAHYRPISLNDYERFCQEVKRGY